MNRGKCHQALFPCGYYGKRNPLQENWFSLEPLLKQAQGSGPGGGPSAPLLCLFLLAPPVQCEQIQAAPVQQGRERTGSSGLQMQDARNLTPLGVIGAKRQKWLPWWEFSCLYMGQTLSWSQLPNILGKSWYKDCQLFHVRVSRLNQSACELCRVVSAAPQQTLKAKWHSCT